MEEAKNQAADHWEYVKGLLEAHNTAPSMIEVVKFHYQSAFVHGFGHGAEYSRYVDAGKPWPRETLHAGK